MINFFSKSKWHAAKKTQYSRLPRPSADCHASQKGFSLPELIVVIGIFVIISSVAMFNQGKLSSSVLLTNMSYEVGLAVREAQTYGIGVRVDDTSGGISNGQYGAHFSVEDETSKRQVVVFSDGINGNAANYTYDAGTGEEKYVYEFDNSRGNKIDGICIGSLPPGTPCTAALSNDGSTGYFTSADVLFRRPNPAAMVFAPGLTEPKSDRVYIILSSLNGDDCRAVVVEPTGQIRVEDSSKGACAKTTAN